MSLDLDLATVAIVNALIVIVCGTAFLLVTIIRRSDEVGRLWSMFFVGLIFALFAYIVGAVEDSVWWAFAVGNGAFVGALGLVWVGARRANGHRPLLSLAILSALVTGAIGLLQGPGQGYWTGAIALFAGAAVLCALSSLEFGRGALSRLASSRILAVGLALMALYYTSRTAGFVVLGPENPIWIALYGAETSTLIETALTALGAMTLASIQAERFRRGGELDAEFGTRVTIDGLLSGEAFRSQAEAWLLRSIRARTTLALVLIELADLAEINLAFGRAAGDAAIRLTGRLALTHAPTASLVGHLSPRRFALLMEVPVNDAVDAIGARIGDAVLSTPIDDQDRFRASTFRGTATTRDHGARYDDLFRAAANAVALDRAHARAIADQVDTTAPG